MNKYRVNICYWNNDGGLSLDAKIIAETLENAGLNVFHNGYLKNASKHKRLIWKLYRAYYILLNKFGFKAKKFALNIHLEEIREQNIMLAKKNMMIPNLEWLHQATYEQFEKMDLFLCKTKSAKEFCDAHEFPSEFISFSTLSPYDASYKQQANTFVHIGGKSETKGTIPLVELWANHPEWPHLTVLISSKHYGETKNPFSLKKYERENLTLIEDYVEISELRRLQNESEVHLCLSEAEGFGHYICEPLSAGAIVVTVDGFPMNELVQPERGVLVNAYHDEPLRFARKFLFDAADFENKIEMLLTMTVDEKNKMKSHAREWFIDNDEFFQRTLVGIVKNCVNSIKVC